MSNPDISDVGAATRFGQLGGADPSIATKQGERKWSIRNSLRYLAGQPVTLDENGHADALLPEQPTYAQRLAMRALIKADTGDMRAIEYVTEQLDGKISQTNINMEFQHPPVVNAAPISPEEAARIYNDMLKQAQFTGED